MRKSRSTVSLGIASVAVLGLSLLGSASAEAASSGGKPPSPAGSRARVAAAPDAALRAPRAAPAAQAALRTVQDRIASYVKAHGTEYSFADYLDATTGRIVLETDAPAGVVAPIVDLSKASGPGVQTFAAGSAVEVRHTSVTDSYSRRDDVPAYWGGAGLQSGGFLCSSGYAVVNGAGTRFSTTAGHCFANGATVLTESGANTYGTVSNRYLPTVTGGSTDIELIGGQSYDGRVYTGGVTSSTSLPVVGAGDPSVGYADYCHSGRTTGENCGHTATSVTAQVCTSTGCKSPVISFTGGTMIAGGDSGGTFYVKNSTSVWIRGNVIASGSGTGYATPWSVVSSTLGVSVVTG